MYTHILRFYIHKHQVKYFSCPWTKFQWQTIRSRYTFRIPIMDPCPILRRRPKQTLLVVNIVKVPNEDGHDDYDDGEYNMENRGACHDYIKPVGGSPKIVEWGDGRWILAQLPIEHDLQNSNEIKGLYEGLEKQERVPMFSKVWDIYFTAIKEAENFGRDADLLAGTDPLICAL